MLSYQQQHVAACSISVPSVPTPPARGGVGLTGDLTLALAASLRLGRGSTILSLHDTDPGLFLFYPKNFLVRERDPELFTGQKKSSMEGTRIHRGQSGGRRAGAQEGEGEGGTMPGPSVTNF